jgi:RNase P protein component
VRAILAKRNDYGDPIDLIIVIRPSYSEEAFHGNEAELNECLNKIKELLH